VSRIDEVKRLIHALPAASILAAVLSLAAGHAAARCDDENRICAAGSPWYTLGSAEIHSNYGDASIDFTLELMPGNDARVHYRFREGKEANEGEVLLVGGRVLALKGGRIERGYEIDYLDGPVLTMQTVVSLLHVAIPVGPAAVHGRRALSTSEAKRRLDVATTSASAKYGAPWTLTGWVERRSPESIAFDLNFVYMPLDPFGGGTNEKPQSLSYSGSLGFPKVRAALPDDFSLSEWNVLGLGPQREQRGGSTKLDYGASAMDRVPRTVGEVRAAIREETNPGTPDPSLNLTGFWKEKCEENHGLHIARAGTDGMYSVSFCGPGGCFEPGTYRPSTYISGDRSYQVISATEIRVLGGDGWATYRRCGDKPPAPVRESAPKTR